MKKIVIVMLCAGLMAFGVACGDDDNGVGDVSEYTIELDGKTLRNARFSPDGDRLAALATDQDSGDEDVVVMDSDGSNVTVVAEDVSYLTVPTWRADGSAVVYNHNQIYEVDPDGGQAEEFASASFASMSPDLSPDESLVVFGINGGNLQLEDLTESEAGTVDFGMPGNSPRFSPEGTQIAFATSSAISLMDVDGENLREVATEELSYLSSVSWFPDGQRLAITSERGIEILDIDSGEREVIDDQFASMAVDVSPQGDRLVYGINGRDHLVVIEGL